MASYYLPTVLYAPSRLKRLVLTRRTAGLMAPNETIDLRHESLAAGCWQVDRTESLTVTGLREVIVQHTDWVDVDGGHLVHDDRPPEPVRCGGRSQPPADEDTRVLALRHTTIGGLPCRVEGWSWDGIWGTSYIFALNDLGGRDGAAMVALVREATGLPPEQITTWESEGWLFVNACSDDS